MPRQKNAWTLEEHRATGRQLYEIRTALVLMSCWIGNTYRLSRFLL